MSFKRNFYKASAVCPKCESSNPQPKYIRPDMTWYNFQIDSWIFCRRAARDLELPEPEQPDFNKSIIPDKVVCLCRCSHEWEEKETN